MTKRFCLVLFLLLGSELCLLPVASLGQPYDLRKVQDMEMFGGSAAAKELLRKNGFVVADPAFKQISDPYVKSPTVERDTGTNMETHVMPSFITADSAWHTYHFLLEKGVKELEEAQCQRLAQFSRLLVQTAQEQERAGKGGPEIRRIITFASTGLAFQDGSQTLNRTEQSIVEGLKSGTGEVQAPIGFGLSPQQFQAQGFYTQSPELRQYYAARQWYAQVIFRLSEGAETAAALRLATLVNDNPELLTLWKQLSEPFDTLLALPEDGSVPAYAEAAKLSQADQVRKKLESTIPFPRINDQRLSLSAFANFSQESRGFRLLPPRFMPCSLCFQNTTDPVISNRLVPSGLDFMAASQVLRSDAAVRAVSDQFGKKVCDAILKTDCGLMPDSLHGEALQLLAKLQAPLAANAPSALRTPAWSDLQLWTQLGAWSEQRHTWALHAKEPLTISAGIAPPPPKGMVAPYPEFFAGLGALSRRSAVALQRNGVESVKQLNEFAQVCDRLAELAKKSLSGEALSEDDGEWIEGYGDLLSAYRMDDPEDDDFPVLSRVFANSGVSQVLYAGVAHPQALYVIIPNGRSLQLYRGAVMTYREFARSDSQLLDDESWREMVRKGEAPPAPRFTRSFYAEKTASEWINELKKYSSEMDEMDKDNTKDFDAIPHLDVEEVIWQLNSCATEKDIPKLLALMEDPGREIQDNIPALARIVAHLPCKAYQSLLIKLLGTKDAKLANAAGWILAQNATNLDAALLVSGFDSQRLRARCLRCALLADLPRQTTASSAVLLRALQSTNEAIRWQAARAIGQAHWSNNAPVEALLRHIKETNELVAAVAARSLAKLGATNTAPELLAELKVRLALPAVSDKERKHQRAAVTRDANAPSGGDLVGDFSDINTVDPDGMLSDFSFFVHDPTQALPLPPRYGVKPGDIRFVGRTSPYIIDSLAESLGALRYQPAESELVKLLAGSHVDAAFTGLHDLAPKRLEAELVKGALDRQAPPRERESALIYLCRAGATNELPALAPLLDDTTAVSAGWAPRGSVWRICDRTADTMAAFLGWRRLEIGTPQPTCDSFIAKVKQWANSDPAR